MRKIMMGLLLSCWLLSGCGQENAWQSRNFEQEPEVSLYLSESGEVKTLRMEEYLAGVVAAEMNPDWPQEALAAQAILARTFAAEVIASGRVRDLHGTDLSDSVEECQAYDPSRINEAVLAAVEKTRGQVLTWQGEYPKAWFSACDGGISASALEGLNYQDSPTPYLKAGVQDGCLNIAGAEEQGWQVQIPVSEVEQAVSELSGIEPGTIVSGSIGQTGESGRAMTVVLNGLELSAMDLRLALGSTRVRSTLWTSFAVKDGYLWIVGRGYGHGVGMCQWGARLLAENNYTAAEIINFYFQDTELASLWP